ncbi:hypothetical protein SAMN00768000_0232 [Sulfobacillus thermosulfidooxidans DSM 9293]|uniref:Uncharacterized protein n=1 Tax=Sulfobacillus thermosulfidooxidans (strain DSM 9293 / VKM B-1269 / AT-1) TaxID=929705 RepID=A0A1W1W8E0_SULTA|nr:hypothetical protein [Sulfobacillus thermosulfidooxidans]SMC02023.1 hypothetical protein SAMN00768000_0232 [Sulfobacillus thermosulfidooxidans DSM 9293]
MISPSNPLDDFRWMRPDAAHAWCWCRRHPAVIQRTTLDGTVTTAYCLVHWRLWWLQQYGDTPPALDDVLRMPTEPDTGAPRRSRRGRRSRP